MLRILKETYSVSEVGFLDHAFFIDTQRVDHFCDLPLERNLKVRWSCCAKADMVDVEILKKMHRAGCRRITYGYQPGSQQLLELLNMNLKTELIEECCHRTKEAGIEVKGGFLLGCFGESGNTLEESAKFIGTLPLDYLSLAFFKPMPGSEAYSIATQYGDINTDWGPKNGRFLPDGIKAEELISCYSKICRQFYLSPKRMVSGLVNGQFTETLLNTARNYHLLSTWNGAEEYWN